MSSIRWLLDTIIEIYLMLVIAAAVLSWLIAFDVVNMRNRFVYQISRFLDAVGQGGHFLSPHYDDFLGDWKAVRHKKMRMTRADADNGVLRLRPIIMTMLVATLGLLPAAMSHAIGSDSPRPFAIVIVGGLISDLVMSIFLLPTLYVWVAQEGDKLPTPESEEI